MERIKKYIEKNKTVRNIEIVFLILFLLISAISFYIGSNALNRKATIVSYIDEVTLYRDDESDDCDEDSSACQIVYTGEYSEKLSVTYPYDEYTKIDNDSIKAYKYLCDDGTVVLFDHQDPSDISVQDAYRAIKAEQMMPIFNLANALLILFISLLIVMLFSGFFTLYEKVWFMSIMVLATIFAVLFPEESANGVNGIIIMLLYLLDTFLNILCELLISKQSRYNFLVSVLVEITEIVMSIVLMYRFATMTVTLFFWLPIDIISFINWSRHKDDKEDELTVVRRLKGYQEVLVIAAIVIWTVVVGYFISGLNIATDFINEDLETVIIYLDACASAVGIANGLFIFFRLREQWIAWYICALLESIINILTGQYVLLILKLGYFTNTTYGYIKWSKYIKSRNIDENSLF